ncbi:MAG TPA: L-threonylcarbamoyladenylate synthase [Acidobacteriota bacterium]|nr:L-threonylcarbamoyladenylate synthase [Acidobacteriota bacterium]
MRGSGIIPITRRRPSAGAVKCLCRRLSSGNAIVIPTETQYALSVAATDPEAVRLVRCLKGRGTKPFSIFLADPAALAEWHVQVPLWAAPLMRRFWPGPLTLILPSDNPMFALLGAGGSGVGIRVSSEPIVSVLARRLGVPLVATSANPSGEHLSARRENRWLGSLAQADEILWARPVSYRRRPASTVIDCTGKRPRLLRDGAISVKEWRASL